MKIEFWKKANDIYSTLVHMSKNEALDELEHIENIDDEIKKIVVSLITSGEQSSQYFKNHVSSDYNLKNITFSTWQSGNKIGDYQLIKEIGKGGMSTVFSAKRINSEVQKLVAIKIFSPNGDSNELKRRFVEEQKILSNLSHPNIIAMHHGETTQSGESYIVMDLVEKAMPLDEYVKLKKLTTLQKIEIILDIAKALAYSHRNLIIHRDIKPSNIIVSTDGSVKIVDFGIAKQITRDAIDKTTIRALTPTYASPEQINAQAITVASDIFSLAAVCVAILIDDNPLPKDRILKSCETDEGFLQKLFKTQSFDKDLENILNKALKYNPNRRYQNMEKFAEDLSDWLANKPVSATPDSFGYRVKKFAIRRKALFASLLTLIFSMTVALIAFSWQYNKTKIEAQKAQQVKQFMLNAFRVTDPNSSQGIEISANDLLKMASDSLISNTKLDVNTKLDLHQTIAVAFGQLGFYNAAVENLNESLSIQPDNTHTLSLLSEYLLQLNSIDEIKKLIGKIDIDDIASIEDRNRMLRVKIRLHALNGEIESMDDLLKRLDIEPQYIEDTIENKRLMAEMDFVKGDATAAIKIIKSTLKDTDLKPNHTLVLGLNNDLIKYLNKTGQYDEALNINKKIITQLRLILGDRHPELGNSLNQLSQTYRLKGDMAQAYVVASDAKQIFYKLYGENSLGVAQSLNKLGMLDYLSGKKTEAITAFEKSVTIYNIIYPPEHLEILKAQVSLAGLYTATGKQKEAELLLQKVYNIQKIKLGESHVSTLNTQQHLARALTALNKLPQAIRHAKLSYELAKDNYEDSDPIVDAAEFILAKTYFKAQKYNKALELFLTRQQRYNKKLSNKKSHTYANLLWDIAKTYVAIKEFKLAEKYFLNAIKAYDDVYSPTHIRSLRMRLVYASFLHAQDRVNESKEIVNSVTKIYQQKNHDEPRLISMIENLNQKFVQNR